MTALLPVLFCIACAVSSGSAQILPNATTSADQLRSQAELADRDCENSISPRFTSGDICGKGNLKNIVTRMLAVGIPQQGHTCERLPDQDQGNITVRIDLGLQKCNQNILQLSCENGQSPSILSQIGSLVPCLLSSAGKTTSTVGAISGNALRELKDPRVLLLAILTVGSTLMSRLIDALCKGLLSEDSIRGLLLLGIISIGTAYITIAKLLKIEGLAYLVAAIIARVLPLILTIAVSVVPPVAGVIPLQGLASVLVGAVAKTLLNSDTSCLSTTMPMLANGINLLSMIFSIGSAFLQLATSSLVSPMLGSAASPLPLPDTPAGGLVNPSSGGAIFG